MNKNKKSNNKTTKNNKNIKKNTSIKQKSNKTTAIKITKSNKTNNLLKNKTYKEAETLYKEKKYNEACKEYLSLSEKFPKNKKVYKRLLECLTHDFTYKEKNKEFKTLFDDYITTYKILATKKEISYLEKKLENYKNIKVKGSKSKFLLIAFLGFFGVHKFIEKKYIIGIAYLLTLGFFGIGVIVDLIYDYAEYEDDLQLDIFRYIISLIIIIFALLKYDTINYYYLIIIAIILMPIVYDKLLKLIPNIIKIIIIIILCYFGFKTEIVIDYVPNSVLGTWKTTNESTNYKEVIIKKDKTTIKFNDRKDQIGNNEYDKENEVLKVYINATTYYRFKIDLEESIVCSYNESNKCIVSFEKEKK